MSKPNSRSTAVESPSATEDEPLLEVEGITKHFRSDSGFLAGLTFNPKNEGIVPLEYDRAEVRAVEDVSFDIQQGETLGIVGESGCGKSTLARTILQLVTPTDGAVYFKGEDLAKMSGKELRKRRKNMQMIFQDPQSSLNPRMKVGRIVEEPLKTHGLLDSEGRKARVRNLLEKVGLDPQHYNRYPHEFSGGQRQRINLARAFSVDPDFIVCDEPVSALDVSIQAQVLNTMRELQDEFGVTFLIISHDLSVMRYIADRIAVMYLGQLIEVADKEELFENPQHPYTQALLGSIPIPDPRAAGQRSILQGDVPSPIDPPSGCRFRTRCPKLIPPTQYDFASEEWDALREFLRAVKHRTFALSEPQDIRHEFFPQGLPGGEPGRITEEAIELVVADRWADAAALLNESFEQPSICAREKPEYEIPAEHGTDRHYVGCHIHRDENPPLTD